MRPIQKSPPRFAASMLFVLLAACQQGAPETDTTAPAADAASVTTEAAPDDDMSDATSGPMSWTSPDNTFAWPGSLKVMGDGYPNAGDACRRLSESAATSKYLDDSAMLVGCPGVEEEDVAKAVDAAGGSVVGSTDGVTLISVPMGDANKGM